MMVCGSTRTVAWTGGGEEGDQEGGDQDCLFVHVPAQHEGAEAAVEEAGDEKGAAVGWVLVSWGE